MSEHGRVLALIPARAGSRGLPRKHLLELGGRPLCAWSFDAARGATGIDRIVVSTDCPEVAALAETAGLAPPFARPPELATDEAPLGAVARHALDWLLANEGDAYDWVLLLQPTSPLRTAAMVDRALTLFFSEDRSCEERLVSVTAAEVKTGLLMRADGEGGVGFCLDVGREPRRQGLPELFLPNGALYITHASRVHDGFYGGRMLPFVMTAEESIDVDTPEDLERARLLLACR